MIYIPKNSGVSNLVIEQKRVIYMNNFEFGKFSDFMPGADNLPMLKNINDMVIGPMLDDHGEVSGLFFFYNS